LQIFSRPAVSPLQPDRQTVLRAKAQDLEAAFLAEMLAHAGSGAARESFGGGIGEDQFASFLQAEQAKAFAAKGGIGLAEHFLRSMMGAGQADA
jgi:peptidoglycan hydrolase FlgJ